MTTYQNEGWSSGDFAGYQVRLEVDPYDEYCDIKIACADHKLPMVCCGARVDTDWNACNCVRLLWMPSLDERKYPADFENEQDDNASDCHFCGGGGCPSCDSDSFAP